MNPLNLGPAGVALEVAADDSHLQQAAEAETLGYSTIWLPGGQIDALDRLAALTRATTSVSVAPAILSVDTYTPTEVARLFTELQATHPNRFVVGLGGPHGPRPLQALNRYLDRLEDADTPVPPDRRLLAALGPRKLELARDRAAGAVPLLVTPGYTAEARAILGDGATLAIDQLVVLDTDPNRARDTARGPLQFLSTLAGYSANFARMGFTDTDIASLSDHLVDQLVAWGDTDALTARIQQHLHAGADHVLLHVVHQDNQPGPIKTARQLADKLVPKS
jgi:probable F420-dependent oxidoreductase